MKMKRWLFALIVLAALLVPSAAYAAVFQEVTVTAAPAYISITNAPSDWTPNDIVGDGVTPKGTMGPNKTYYSNPLGDATSPTVGGALDTECRFTITNASSVATNLTVLFPHHTGGDASQNSDDGNPTTVKFGARTYFSGQASGAWVVAKNTGSSIGRSDLGAATHIKWGLIYKSQTDAWTSGTSMASTVVITATIYM